MLNHVRRFIAPTTRRDRRRLGFRLPLLGVLALACGIAGCGSDDKIVEPGNGDPKDPGDDVGFYTVTVSGVESFVATGAYAFSGGEANESGWEVGLESLDGTSPLRMVRLDSIGDRPPVGEYAVVSSNHQPGDGEFTGVCRTTASGASYYATEGRLTITSSSDDYVEGNFTFSAETNRDAKAITVTGVFRAVDVLDE